MTRAFRILAATTFATAALLLGACAPKAPVTSSVTAADQVAIKYETAGAANRLWCSCTAGPATAATGTSRPNISPSAISRAARSRRHGESGRERKDYTVEASVATSPRWWKARPQAGGF